MMSRASEQRPQGIGLGGYIVACGPTVRASAAAEARYENCQNAHDLARRRRSAASAGWVAGLIMPF